MEVDWDLVDKQIKQKPPFSAGLSEIKNLLNTQGLQKLLDDIDGDRMLAQFQHWLETILSFQEIPEHIQSVYVGLFSVADEHDNEITTIHFSGSPFTPEEDEDWACEVEDSFLPEKRYMILTDFMLLDENMQDLDVGSELEELVYVGVLNLLVFQAFRKFKESILRNHESLFVGAGYDEGDIFPLGELTKKGWK